MSGRPVGNASGKSNTALASQVRWTNQTVGRWRARFLERRLDGLLDEPWLGAPRRIGDADVERVLTLTLETAPKDKPFIWTKSADEILATVARSCTRISDSGH